MQKYAQDAMAYVLYYGRPDLFIPFTCNPACNEIQQLSLPGQSQVDEIDDVICIEIPWADFNMDLHAVIIKNMIHGPCGTLNPSSPFMVDGKGSKKFPRAFIANTITGNDGYHRTATAGSDVVQSGRPIFDDFFQHLWPYIGNNTANVVFQMVKHLWFIRID
ncbi:helitron_like_N domain-containing protein [Trichonephila clavipes]|nr:helitron_like_N domain-containing protein [Trichonephila clavipes]